MKIYGHRSFGNPRRVAIFLDEKGVDLPFEPVDLGAGAHKTPDFLAKNPAGQVPVLELDDGTCIAETQAICRYLEDLYPEPNLMGVDSLERALIEMWQRRVEFGVFSSGRYYVRHCTRMGSRLEPVQIPAWGELNREWAPEQMQSLDRRLAKSRFLSGERFSVADITLIFALQGVTARGGVSVPDDCEGLKRWLRDVSARPSVAATAPPGD
ncbi:MAG: glutathione S-transferase family protein [Myxococcales bacterium]|nr:glutathione S-transferase family protein [Myxococcales bacterium]